MASSPTAAVAGSVPRPEDADAAWLEAMLGDAGIYARIVSLTTGQLGETVRFRIERGGGSGDVPDTLIGKFASTDPTSLQVAGAWSLYQREVGFYRQLSAKARIATPRCYGSAIEESGNFALLLEDMAPARPGDQIKGISVADAERAVREGARLHAAFWGQGEDPALAWLETGPLAQPFYSADVFRSTWAGFRERYAEQLSEDQRRVCEAMNARYEAYGGPLKGRSRCISHNDFRPDNMLFGADGRLTVVDWQSAGLGYNAVDISYLIGGAFAPEERRQVEGGLLDAYHDELLVQGVADYPRAHLDADYRHFTFAGINVAVGAAMLVKRTERGDRLFLTMLDRHVTHALDLDALAVLDG